MPEQPPKERLNINLDCVTDADEYLFIRGVLTDEGYTEVVNDHWVRPTTN